MPRPGAFGTLTRDGARIPGTASARTLARAQASALDIGAPRAGRRCGGRRVVLRGPRLRARRGRRTTAAHHAAARRIVREQHRAADGARAPGGGRPAHRLAARRRERQHHPRRCGRGPDHRAGFVGGLRGARRDRPPPLPRLRVATSGWPDRRARDRRQLPHTHRPLVARHEAGALDRHRWQLGPAVLQRRDPSRSRVDRPGSARRRRTGAACGA